MWHTKKLFRLPGRKKREEMCDSFCSAREQLSRTVFLFFFLFIYVSTVGGDDEETTSQRSSRDDEKEKRPTRHDVVCGGCEEDERVNAI